MEALISRRLGGGVALQQRINCSTWRLLEAESRRALGSLTRRDLFTGRQFVRPFACLNRLGSHSSSWRCLASHSSSCLSWASARFARLFVQNQFSILIVRLTSKSADNERERDHKATRGGTCSTSDGDHETRTRTRHKSKFGHTKAIAFAN